MGVEGGASGGGKAATHDAVDGLFVVVPRTFGWHVGYTGDPPRHCVRGFFLNDLSNPLITVTERAITFQWARRGYRGYVSYPLRFLRTQPSFPQDAPVPGLLQSAFIQPLPSASNLPRAALLTLQTRQYTIRSHLVPSQYQCCV